MDVSNVESNYNANAKGNIAVRGFALIMAALRYVKVYCVTYAGLIITSLAIVLAIYAIWIFLYSAMVRGWK